MASTWSALKVELLETGANAGSWGTLTNANLGDAVLGEAITGQATVDFATDADVTITLTDAATTQAARNLRLNITESSSGVGSVRNLILGSGCQIEKFYLINNTGTGAKTVKNTSGTGISVPAGKATLVYNNGTNVVDAASYFTSLTLGSALPIASGGTGSTSTTFVNLASNVTGLLPIANGGTATATPALVQGSGVTITGTWPNQTINATGTGGTVTSVAVSGGTTGLTTSGGPITTSGTITLAGTVATTNGGTGLTSFTSGGVVYASSSSALATGSALVFDGTNLGVGVTPSAWRTGLADRAIDVGETSALYYQTGGATALLNNAYRGAGNTIRYKITGTAQAYWQESGQHYWQTAASGTAGDAISFTTRMLLEGTDRTNLLVGTTSSTFSAASRGVIEVAGSSTALVSLKGSSALAYIFNDGGNLNIANEPAGVLQLSNNGAVRFQIGSAGQFGIGGATYGSSGQVLTSGGSGAAPTWAAAAGGVTSVATSGGLTGGTITSTGTLSIDTNNVKGIGSYSLCQNVGTDTNSADTRAGSSLNATAGEGPGNGNTWFTQNTTAYPGTWRNATGGTVQGSSSGTYQRGLWIRTA